MLVIRKIYLRGCSLLYRAQLYDLIIRPSRHLSLVLTLSLVSSITDISLVVLVSTLAGINAQALKRGGIVMADDLFQDMTSSKSRAWRSVLVFSMSKTHIKALSCCSILVIIALTHSTITVNTSMSLFLTTTPWPNVTVSSMPSKHDSHSYSQTGHS
jgi:hypothetical protein